LAFENATAQTGTGSADTGVPGSPAVADLFGNDFRMSSWGLRFDFTATNPDDPAFTARWTEAIQKLRGSSASLALTQSVSDLIEDEDGNIDPVYEAWEASARTALQAASVADFKQVLQNQLDLLIASEILAHPDFMQRIGTLNIAFSNYTEERDALLKEIQSHRFTFEYTNQHPRNAPNTSNARFIYSHQPFEKVPVLLTANAGFTWYNADPATAGAGRLRDVQFAGQLDRRLGQIGNFGNAVLTFSGYYQWMKEDALINIGPGSIAPGSGIVLPGAAAKLLGTKGHIGIVQGKVSIPVGDVVKIPFSLTWSNRTELIKKEDLRGQVGIAFDIDSLFR
jgi:hypothetical protein